MLIGLGHSSTETKYSARMESSFSIKLPESKFLYILLSKCVVIIQRIQIQNGHSIPNNLLFLMSQFLGFAMCPSNTKGASHKDI